MPKRLSVKDTQKIKIAYKIGEIGDKAYYNEILELPCEFATFDGRKSVNDFGTQIAYNATAVFEYNENTRYINEFTKFWFAVTPADSSQESDYEVARVGAVKNGLFTVYLISKTQNASNIWCEVDGTIFRNDTIFDEEILTAVFPKNTYVPIWYNTKVWYREPENTSETEYGIHLVDIVEGEGYRKFVFESGLYNG